jgi:predicted MFS family arabinose efflux permease
MTTEKTHHFFIKAAPLLLVLFIDSMGLGLVIPVLNGLIFDPQSRFLSGMSASQNMHELIYGVVIGLFMLCWFFGAAILGDISDKIGRKKSLAICLAGAFLSYGISALAIFAHSLSLLLIGRAIGGFTSGSQPIAQAAIVDLSLEEHKTRNFGYMLLALSLGFILGPLFGGLFSDSRLVSWFNYATPFYFAAILSLANILFLAIFFKESFEVKPAKVSVHPLRAIELFASAFKHKTVRIVTLLYCLLILGWSSFYSFIAMFLMKRYAFNPTQVSIYMAVMGIGFVIGNGFLVDLLTKKFKIQHCFIAASLASGVLALLIAGIPIVLVSWILIAPLACCFAVATATSYALFSKQVGPESQGWVMGITGAAMALVFGLGGIVVGAIATISALLPLYIAGACLLLTAFSAYKISHKI